MNTKRLIVQIPIATAILAVSTLTPGCVVAAVGVAAGAGAGSVAYVRGELDAHLGSPFEAVAAAEDKAVAQLQFLKINEAKDAFSEKIVARDAEDKKVEITATKESDNLTKVTIRIGMFGDEEKSHGILDKINANL
jgi:uncharacterized protein DUF3568